MSSSQPQVSVLLHQGNLFVREEFVVECQQDNSESVGIPRLRQAERQQVRFLAACWDELLPEEHQARVIWGFVQELDLSPITSKFKAVERHVGASNTDPRILMALWLYATLRGVGSARELDRRCGEDGEVPFQWICGGVSVNYHSLSDFRTTHVDYLETLLTQSVASLMHEGLVDLQRVAQDGMRVRASAGSKSFRRRATLEECLKEAEDHLETLKQEQEKDKATESRRHKAAQQRAARERVQRIEAALKHMPELEAKKKKDEKDKARVSTTDAEARVMKMANGGFNAAYNAQLATDTKSQIITGVDITNNGGDRGEMSKMVDQHKERFDQIPEEYLVDGGFSSSEEVAKVSADPDAEDPSGTTVIAPVRKSKHGEPHKRRDSEPKAVGDCAIAQPWRTPRE